MPLTARLEDQIAGAAVHDLIAEQRANASVDYVAVLVLTAVAVERGSQRARRHWMLDEREAATGLRSVDHEADPDLPKLPHLAVVCAQHLCSLRWLHLFLRFRWFGGGSTRGTQRCSGRRTDERDGDRRG
jgi:hypothetical protein